MIAWLGDRDEEELRTFLLADPVQNLFLLGALETHGVTGIPGETPVAFAGVRRNGRLAGVVFVGGNGRLLVPSCTDPADAEEAGAFLADRYRIEHVVGERSASDALWSALALPPPRICREHRLLVLTPEACGPHVCGTLRAAGHADLEPVVELGRQLHWEELGVDPLAADAVGFRLRVAGRIAAGRVFVAEENGTVAFRAEVGTRCRSGAQIEGVVTAPAFRRRGLATRAMGQLARNLLASLPRVTLHVAADNAPALALYRRLGFVPALPFRRIVAA